MWYGWFCDYHAHTSVHSANRACHPCGHYWDYYSDTLSLSHQCKAFECQAPVDFICRCWSSDGLQRFNSSRPSATYMRQWIRLTLVEIMACCLFGTKPLSEPMLAISQLDPQEQTQWNFNQNTKLFIRENVSENIVCKMAARGRWVN